MSSWIGTARTNYVKVKDQSGLEQYFAKFGNQVKINLVPLDSGRYPGMTCFIGDNPDSGDFPSVVWDAESKEVIFEWSEVCKFLEPEQILVVMTSGAERKRYVTGTSEAYHTTTGKSTFIDISHIYKQAAKKFNVDIDSINLCQF